MAVNLGTLYVTLEARTAALMKGQQQVTRSAERMERDLARVTGSAKALAAALGAGSLLYSAKALSTSIVNASISLERMQNSLKAATGSAAAGAAELEYVRGEAKRLGLDLESSATSYAKLTAAAKGTELQGQAVRDVFTAVSEASTVMGLSAEQTEGALRALEQMISKGNVQAEELRGQLGERIPGAFNIAARAMGVTTTELNEMLRDGEVLAADLLPKLAQELRRTFGDQVADAADSTQAKINRFRTAIFELKNEISEAGVIDAFAGSIELATKHLKEIATVAGVAGGTIASVYVARGLGAIGGAAASAVTAQAKLIQSTLANQRATAAAAAADLRAAKEKQALTAARLRDAKAAADAGFVETEASRKTAASAVRDADKARALLQKSAARANDRRATLAAAEAEVFAARQAATQGYGSMRKVEQATRARDRALKALNVELTRQAAYEARVALAEAKTAAVTATSAANRRIAMQQLALARQQHAAATAAATAAEAAHATALRATTVAANAARLAVGGLKSALSLLGGPLGVAFLAAEGLLIYSMRAKNASAAQRELTSDVKQFFEALRDMDRLQSARIDESVRFARKEIIRLKHELEAIEEMPVATFGSGKEGYRQVDEREMEKRRERIAAIKEEIHQWGLEIEYGNEALERAKKQEGEFAASASGASKSASEVSKALESWKADMRLANEELRLQLAGQEKLIPLLRARTQLEEQLGRKLAPDELAIVEAMVAAQAELNQQIEAATERESLLNDIRQEAAGLTAELAQATREGDAAYQQQVDNLNDQIRLRQAEIAGNERAVDVERQLAEIQGHVAYKLTPDQLAVLRSLLELRNRLTVQAEEHKRLQALANEVIESQISAEQRLATALANVEAARRQRMLTDQQAAIEARRLNEEHRRAVLEGQVAGMGGFEQIGAGLKEGFRSAALEAENFFTIAEQGAVNLASTLENAFVDSFAGLIQGTVTAEEAMRKLGTAVVGELLKMTAQMIYQATVGQALQAALTSSSAAAASGLAAAWAPAAIGASIATFGAAALAGGAAYTAAIGAGTAAASAASAFGGAGGATGLAKGGIVDRPTMVSPTQYAGEAGPEAVLPLTRTRGGNLGVMAEGGGGAIVNVNIINNAGAQIEQRESIDANGNRQVDVIVEQSWRRSYQRGLFDKDLKRHGAHRRGGIQ